MPDVNGSSAPAPPTDTAAWTAKARPVVDIAARILCLLLGGALLVGGLVSLFTGVDKGQLVIVLAAGLLLIVMPSIVDRIRTMRLGQFEVHLVRQIAATARKSAEILRRQGLETQLDAYATTYIELRGREFEGVRGEILDRILQRVANASAVEKFDPGEVKDLFWNGSPIVRVLALGLMEGDRSLIDADVLLDAVNRSLTGNEQYHALKLIRDGWTRLAPDDRHRLLAAIESSPHITMDTDRGALAQQIRELAVSSRIG
jgi:hypothetical protein